MCTKLESGWTAVGCQRLGDPSVAKSGIPPLNRSEIRMDKSFCKSPPCIPLASKSPPDMQKQVHLG